jgi:preprotein translocase subunit SecY
MNPRQVYRRVRRVIALQWRGIAIVLIIIADVIFFSVVFVFQDNVVQSVADDPTKAGAFVKCLFQEKGKKEPCLDKASSLVINEATVTAVLLLLAVSVLYQYYDVEMFADNYS